MASSYLRNLPKHQKYATYYKPNDLYWGLGVEHETYLEATPRRSVNTAFIVNNRRQERYSVNYYASYHYEDLINALSQYFQVGTTTYELPILLNSHSFTCLDASGEHRTNYEKIPRANINFNGELLIDTLKKHCQYFDTEYDRTFIFDGDTIEFMTQNFYKANVHQVIDELQSIERNFISYLNSTLESLDILTPYLPFHIQNKNYPFVTFLTNMKNASMFNNGTIHINITLPTILDISGNIANYELFEKQHRHYANIIQWIEPLQVALFGSPDPFSKVNSKFSAASQRLAVSRYVGLGTFDTETMPRGKILQVPRTSKWFNEYQTSSAYTELSQMGIDINFNKHFNHGLEIRIFDAISIQSLQELLMHYVYLADFSLQTLSCATEFPINRHPIWEQLAKKILTYGKYASITQNELELYWKLFMINKKYEVDETPEQLYTDIMYNLHTITKNGLCNKLMLQSNDSGSKAVTRSARAPDSTFVQEVSTKNCYCWC